MHLRAKQGPQFVQFICSPFVRAISKSHTFSQNKRPVRTKDSSRVWLNLARLHAYLELKSIPSPTCKFKSQSNHPRDSALVSPERETSLQVGSGDIQEFQLNSRLQSSPGENGCWGWTLWHHTPQRSLSSLSSNPKSLGISQLGSGKLTLPSSAHGWGEVPGNPRESVTIAAKCNYSN